MNKINPLTGQPFSRSTTDESRRTYYDYGMDFPAGSEWTPIDTRIAWYHVYEQGDALVIELDHILVDVNDFAQMVKDEARRSYIHAEHELFEPISSSGLDFLYADDLNGLSEAPCFMSAAYIPDWIASVKEQAAQIKHKWSGSSIPWSMAQPSLYDYWAIDWDRSVVWSAIEYYQIESPLDRLAETGRCEFKRA